MKTRVWWENKFLRAAQRTDPEGYLVREALNFKAEGGTWEEAEDIVLTIWMTHYNHDDTPREMYNHLQTVCDAITGYCAGGNHLFAEDFKEHHYYRPIPPSVAEQ